MAADKTSKQVTDTINRGGRSRRGRGRGPGEGHNLGVMSPQHPGMAEVQKPEATPVLAGEAGRKLYLSASLSGQEKSWEEPDCLGSGGKPH